MRRRDIVRSTKDIGSAPLMAASIFLDALNVFQFFRRRSHGWLI